MYTISEMSKKWSVAVLTIVLYRFQTDEPVWVSLVGEIIEFFLKDNRKERELFNLHALLLYQMGNMKIISQKDQKELWRNLDISYSLLLFPLIPLHWLGKMTALNVF